MKAEQPSDPAASDARQRSPGALLERLLLGGGPMPAPPADADLSWWRSRSFASLLRVFLPLSVLAWVPGVAASLYAGMWQVVVIDTAVLAGVVWIWRADPIRYRARVGLVLATLFLLACALLVMVGVHGGGFIFLLSFLALTALLLGRRAAARGLGLTLAVLPPLALVAWPRGEGMGLVGWLLEWSASAGSMVLLGAAIAVATSDITEGMESVIQRERRSRAALDEERARLARVNAELQAEVERRERLEAQLRQAGNLDALGRLARGIAHDLNNLLQPLRGHAELLVEASAGRPDLREDAQVVLGSADRAARLVAQVLAFGRQIEPAQERLDLRDLLRDTAGLARVGALRRITVALDLPHAPVWVRGDRGQIQQVLMNLFTNALEASSRAGGKVTLSCGAVQDQGTDAPWLRVRDDGPGMSPEVAQRCFEPFFTTRSGAGGTGLGLAIVHGLVTTMGGTVSMSTEPGAGSTFTVTLPQTEATDAPPPPETVAGPAASSDGSTPATDRAPKVLVVDDEDAVRRLLRRVLEGVGVQVLEAADGDQALGLIQALEAPPDLVLTDRWMPGLTGEELAERICQTYPGLPILLMSGDGPDRSPALLASIGVQRVLAKPVGVQDLRLAVSEALGRPLGPPTARPA